MRFPFTDRLGDRVKILLVAHEGDPDLGSTVRVHLFTTVFSDRGLEGEHAPLTGWLEKPDIDLSRVAEIVYLGLPHQARRDVPVLPGACLSLVCVLEVRSGLGDEHDDQLLVGPDHGIGLHVALLLASRYGGYVENRDSAPDRDQERPVSRGSGVFYGNDATPVPLTVTDRWATCAGADEPAA